MPFIKYHLESACLFEFNFKKFDIFQHLPDKSAPINNIEKWAKKTLINSAPKSYCNEKYHFDFLWTMLSRLKKAPKISLSEYKQFFDELKSKECSFLQVAPFLTLIDENKDKASTELYNFFFIAIATNIFEIFEQQKKHSDFCISFAQNLFSYFENSISLIFLKDSQIKSLFSTKQELLKNDRESFNLSSLNKTLIQNDKEEQVDTLHSQLTFNFEKIPPEEIIFLFEHLHRLPFSSILFLVSSKMNIESFSLAFFRFALKNNKVTTSFLEILYQLKIDLLNSTDNISLIRKTFFNLEKICLTSNLSLADYYNMVKLLFFFITLPLYSIYFEKYFEENSDNATECLALKERVYLTAFIFESFLSKIKSIYKTKESTTLLERFILNTFNHIHDNYLSNLKNKI